MKIGILTLGLRTNYGGLLQAYALQTVLERMGHKAVVFDKSPYIHLPVLKMPMVYIKRVIKKFLLCKKVVFFYEWYHNKSYPIISQYTQRFIDKYIHRQEVSNLEMLNEKNFDAFVVGSDQVWRPTYNTEIANAYLAFAENWQVKRLAYAPSFGVDKWIYSPDQTKRCKELVAKFDLITVREDSGVILCKNYLGIEAKQVLDPTMLLEREDYEVIVKAADTPASIGDMLVYVLDVNPQLEQMVQEVERSMNLTAFYLNSKVQNIFAPIEQRIQKPVEVWLRGFMDAKFVITDSFHACAFAIIFNKPFAVFGNKERGMSRFHSLLKLFELENRLVISANEILQLPELDWTMINERHIKLRKTSKKIIEEKL